MNIYKEAKVPSAWTTKDGHRAHLTHVFHGQKTILAGTVDGLPSTQVWDQEGKVIHEQDGLDLAGLEPKNNPT